MRGANPLGGGIYQPYILPNFVKTPMNESEINCFTSSDERLRRLTTLEIVVSLLTNGYCQAADSGRSPLTPGFETPKLNVFGPCLIFLYLFSPQFARHIISLIFCYFTIQIQKFSSLTFIQHFQRANCTLPSSSLICMRPRRHQMATIWHLPSDLP